jgi:small subunit ribosomal protein SAe
MSHFPAALQPKEEDIKKLLAVGAHIGTTNVDSAMNRYIWRCRPDGIHLINLAKTWEKLVLAARVIAGVENAGEVCVISGPTIGQRAALKFANFTGAHAIAGRYTPGTFTNQIQEKFIEPRLLLITDPRADHQAITESSYVNLPTIALCNSDSSVKNIDIVIPCNNRSTESVGLIFWLLAREILYLRGTIPRSQQWDVMVDLFFYRPPEEIIAEKKAQEEAQQALQQQQGHHAPHVDQFRPPHHEGSDFHAQGDSAWDSAQGESWAGGNTRVAQHHHWIPTHTGATPLAATPAPHAAAPSPVAAPQSGWESTN